MNIDYQKYLKVCSDAVASDTVFNQFKSLKEYRRVLEHVTYNQGLVYLQEIQTKSPFLLGTLSKFNTNDKIGYPLMNRFESINKIMSPTTLRYIKVLGDLLNIFGCIDCKDIVEIGVGYGGQCKIIHDYCEPRSYTLVDLQEVLALAKKYLIRQGVDMKNISFRTPDDLTEKEYSLFISNYAFTEINREYQDIYANAIIKHCTNGYMTCNFIDQRGEDGAFSLLEILSLHKNYKVYPEIPLTSPSNLIYTWTSKDK